MLKGSNTCFCVRRDGYVGFKRRTRTETETVDNADCSFRGWRFLEEMLRCGNDGLLRLVGDETRKTLSTPNFLVILLLLGNLKRNGLQ